MVDMIVRSTVKPNERSRERTEYAPRQVPHAASLARIEEARNRMLAKIESDDASSED